MVTVFRMFMSLPLVQTPMSLTLRRSHLTVMLVSFIPLLRNFRKVPIDVADIENYFNSLV